MFSTKKLSSKRGVKERSIQTVEVDYQTMRETDISIRLTNFLNFNFTISTKNSTFLQIISVQTVKALSRVENRKHKPFRNNYGSDILIFFKF